MIFFPELPESLVIHTVIFLNKIALFICHTSYLTISFVVKTLLKKLYLVNNLRTTPIVGGLCHNFIKFEVQNLAICLIKVSVLDKNV